MTEKEMLIKIIELQAEIIRLKSVSPTISVTNAPNVSYPQWQYIQRTGCTHPTGIAVGTSGGAAGASWYSDPDGRNPRMKP